MADFAFAPEIVPPQSVQYGPPPTLLTVLEDGKAVARQKHANMPELWSETFKLVGSEFDSLKTFYDLKGLLTTFTKLSYDVHGTPTTERTVRFAGPLEWQRAGQDYYIVTLTFERVY